MAVLLLITPNAYRERLAQGIRATVLWPVLAMQRGAVEQEVRFADPERLRAERDSLAAHLVGHATLSAENRHLRQLLGLQQRLPPSFIPAEVIRVPGRGYEGLFLLSVGSAHGVRIEAPIISATGLVGRVRNVDDGLSMAIDWTHPDFRASAMTPDGEITGIVEPRAARAGEPLLILTGTAFHTDLPVGTMIVTSGRGGVYPRGIPVGTVIGMEDEEAGWRRTYLLRPFVSPGEMTQVLVLGDPQADLGDRDLALAWGIRPPEPPPADTVPAQAAGAAAGPRPQAQPAAPAPTPQVATPQQPTPPQILQPIQPRPAGGTGTPPPGPGTDR